MTLDVPTPPLTAEGTLISGAQGQLWTDCSTGGQHWTATLPSGSLWCTRGRFVLLLLWIPSAPPLDSLWGLPLVLPVPRGLASLVLPLIESFLDYMANN